MSVKLDLKDKKLLNHLMGNARQPISTLAKSIGVSKEVANYRIKRLETTGFIKGYYPVVDISGLGYQVYRLQIKYNTTEETFQQSLLTYIKRQSIVSWIYELSGSWDLVILFWVKDLSTYESFYEDLMNKFGQHFQDKLLTIVTRIYHFKRNTVTGIKDRTAIITGMQKQSATVDALDVKILTLLLANARMTLQDLAQHCHITLNAIKYRIRRLEAQKFILGYKPNLDVSLLELDYFKVQLSLTNPQQKKQLLAIIADNIHTHYITESIGPFDLEFEADYHQISELLAFIEKIRETINLKFYDVIYENKVLKINEIPQLHEI